MESEIRRIQRYLAHSKIAVYAIIGFSALLLYLMIIISRQVSNQEEALLYQSNASESYMEMVDNNQTGDNDSPSANQVGDSQNSDSTQQQDGTNQCCSVWSQVELIGSGSINQYCSVQCAGTHRYSLPRTSVATPWTNESCRIAAEKYCATNYCAQRNIPQCNNTPTATPTSGQVPIDTPIPTVYMSPVPTETPCCKAEKVSLSGSTRFSGGTETYRTNCNFYCAGNEYTRQKATGWGIESCKREAERLCPKICANKTPPLPACK